MIVLHGRESKIKRQPQREKTAHTYTTDDNHKNEWRDTSLVAFHFFLSFSSFCCLRTKCSFFPNWERHVHGRDECITQHRQYRKGKELRLEKLSDQHETSRYLLIPIVAQNTHAGQWPRRTRVTRDGSRSRKRYKYTDDEIKIEE